MSAAPYFSDDRVTVYHGDCRVVLASVLEASAVDVVVVDPPYEETSLRWDEWQDGWPAALACSLRTTTPMWCFGSMRMFLANAREFDDWSFDQDIVWEKHNGSSFHNRRFRRVHENIVLWYRGAWGAVYRSPVFTMDASRRTVLRRKKPAHMGEVGEGRYTSFDGGPRLMRSVVRLPSAHGNATGPTQKPTGIIQVLLDYSLPPGGLVLDPMMGSGSTLRAAVDRGGRAIGIEARESECETAVKRWLAQQSLL